MPTRTWKVVHLPTIICPDVTAGLLSCEERWGLQSQSKSDPRSPGRSLPEGRALGNSKYLLFKEDGLMSTSLSLCQGPGLTAQGGVQPLCYDGDGSTRTGVGVS